jgi:hypothetical protein
MLQATDRDQGDNGAVEYDILPQVPSPPLKMELNDGILYTTEEFLLSPESQRQYTFNIRARDKGIPPKETPTNVVVRSITLYSFLWSAKMQE